MNGLAGEHEGTLTAPAVSLTEPWALTACDHTGKPISRSSATSRPAREHHAPDPAMRQRGGQQLAEETAVEGEVVATTSTSPGWHCSTAT